MQDVDLFLSLAEIAGVFVGFGALIAVRGDGSGGTSDTYDVASVGMVVWAGITVVIVALAPVAISRFEVTDHALWVSSSLIALALFWVGNEVVERVFAERRALLAAWPLKKRWRVELVGMFFVLPMTIALILILLGVLPDLEAALYFAALVLLLVLDAWMLLLVVTATGRPRTT